MRKGETCAHSWYKNTEIVENGKKKYISELYCWTHKVIIDEKGERHIKTIPLKPCDDCDDRYVRDIGP